MLEAAYRVISNYDHLTGKQRRNLKRNPLGNRLLVGSRHHARITVAVDPRFLCPWSSRERRYSSDWGSEPLVA